MVKVIKYGQKRRITCEVCGALLEFEKGDVKTVQTGMNEYEQRITCPACNETVVVGKGLRRVKICIAPDHSGRRLQNYVRIAGKPGRIRTEMDTMRWTIVPDAAGTYRQKPKMMAVIACLVS